MITGADPSADIAGPLLAWYRGCARDLPWRRTSDPYAIWVSEIMLQQTRVETVIPYYRRFLEALPAVRDLAACPDEKLLKLWEGLGYYSRVRNMKKAAGVICSEYGGAFPEDAAALMKLPGIGPYTAGAVASIAFGDPQPAVDGNVLRVMARLTGDPSNILDPAVRKRVETLVRDSMPVHDPGTFNQALMELGAMICLSGPKPLCGRCPLQDMCRAHAENLTDVIPLRLAKKEKKMQLWTVLLMHDTQRVLIRRRPESGLLAGMYEFPVMSGHQDRGTVLEKIKTDGLDALQISVLPAARHIFTHLEWQMTGYAVRCGDLTERPLPEGMIAVSRQQLEGQYALPSAYSVYRQALEDLV